MIAAASCRVGCNPGPDRLKLVHVLLTPICEVAITARVMHFARPVQTGSWNAGRGQRAQAFGVPQHHPLPHSHPTPRRQLAVHRHHRQPFKDIGPLVRRVSHTPRIAQAVVDRPGLTPMAFLGAHLLIYCLHVVADLHGRPDLSLFAAPNLAFRGKSPATNRLPVPR